MRVCGIANDKNNDSELRAAASDCIGFFEGAYSELLNSILTGTRVFSEEAFDLVSDFILDKAWELMLEVIPGGKALKYGVKGLRALGNELFKLDKRNECYFKIEAAVTIENSIRRIGKSTSKSYLQSMDINTAELLMQSVSLYQKTVIQGLEYTSEFFNTVGNAPGNKLLNFIHKKYDTCMQLVKNINSGEVDMLNMYETFEEKVRQDYNNLYCKDYDEFLKVLSGELIVVYIDTYYFSYNANGGTLGSAEDFSI